ncbi:inactive peptidyl-prolyl cis-trans isomerase FKBP6-like isoform X2 [Dermacentor silvarum]|uniref:inactive peptidyl-prolyl cis-trans isomerase FKBP6-like isoform X2 n=1 Tax=Dermacentor silvarum TaxID=543639 RepID=UPI002100E46B|nr:inactive peptidyl-prolyl cis-trans isomerase FKBP6-like isoform X2 [Dermacentor silvarum]
MSANEMEIQILSDDGGVKKKITKPGSGPVVPQHATVTFHYNAYVQASWTERIDSTWMRNTPHSCTLEELGILGLKIIIHSMRRGEECQATIAPKYGFGAQGCRPRIPPNATLFYELALIDFFEMEDDGGVNGLDIDSTQLPFDTLLRICFRKYRNGNRFYVANSYTAAERSYAAAAKFLESAPDPADVKYSNKRRELLLNLYSNQAQCALRMHNPKLDLGGAGFEQGVSALVHRTGRGTGHQEPDSPGLGSTDYGKAGHGNLFREYLQPRRSHLHPHDLLRPKASVLRRPGWPPSAPPFIVSSLHLCTATSVGSASKTWQPWFF